jgi:hypothetical protein
VEDDPGVDGSGVDVVANPGEVEVVDGIGRTVLVVPGASAAGREPAVVAFGAQEAATRRQIIAVKKRIFEVIFVQSTMEIGYYLPNYTIFKLKGIDT